MSRLSIAQISALLAADYVRPETIEELKSDPRVAVARLIAQRRRRLAAAEAELARLEELQRYETGYYEQGFRLVAGVDEAGRGPLAGPVSVAAVILPAGCRLPGLNDSKKLSARQREELYTAVKAAAVAVEHVFINTDMIDRLNIYQATLRGMYDVLASLRPQPDAVLIDAMPLPALKQPSRSLVNGDALSASIAAASIIAKVERDRLMDKMDSLYPCYGFARHRGYPTSEHLTALERYGPCPIHRRSFSPLKEWGTLFNEN